MQQIRISHKGVFCRRKLLLQTSSGGRPYLAHSPLAYCQKRYRQDPECLPQRTAKVVAAAGAFLLAVAFLAIALSPASAEADSGREGQMTRVPSTAGEGPLPIPYQGTPKTALKIKFMVGGASHSLPRDTKDSSLGKVHGWRGITVILALHLAWTRSMPPSFLPLSPPHGAYPIDTRQAYSCSS